MDLAKRDILITNLKNQKKEKEQFLIDKRISLNKQKNNNSYLNLVVDEYDDYFNKINKQREEQVNALQILVNYMTQIINDSSSTPDIIKYARDDKQSILNELKKYI